MTLLIFSYFFAQELGDRYHIENEIRALQKQITNLEKSKQDLSELAAYLRSPGYQEKELRRRLNLQKPGEHVVALPPPATTTASGSQPALAVGPSSNNWRLWWRYFFGEK